MKKMRFESCEVAYKGHPPREVARICFGIADQNRGELRKVGIEFDALETVILWDKEYHRKDVFGGGG